MAIAGALIGNAIGAFGKKPKKQYYETVDPTKVQADTVAGNAANFGDIAALAARVNTFNQDQLDALIERRLGAGSVESIKKHLASGLRGEVAPDVVRALTNYRASRGYGALTGGSPYVANLQGLDISRTSEQIFQENLSSAEQWLKVSQAPTFDVTSMFFTPAQRLAQENLRTERKYQQDLLNAGIEAAPDPGTAALGKEIDRFFNTAASFGMMAAGKAIGGGLGGGGGGLAGGIGGGGDSMLSSGLGASTVSPYSLGGYGFNNNWLSSQTNSASANGAHL